MTAEPPQVVYVQAPSGGSIPVVPIVVGAGVAIGAAVAWKLGYVDDLLDMLIGGASGDDGCPAGYHYDATVNGCVPDIGNGGGGGGGGGSGSWSQGGVITDMQYYKLPGAKVTFTNRDTGAAYSAFSDSLGEWYIASAPLGQYDMSVELAGYEYPTSYYVPRTEAKEYAATTIMMQEKIAQQKLETLYLTEANATETISYDFKNGMGYPSIYRWDMVSMLRDKGYSVPGGKVNAGSGISGSITTGKGMGGWIGDILRWRIEAGGRVLGVGKASESKCDETDTVTASGINDIQWYEINTKNDDTVLTGEICKVSIPILVDWQEM